MLLELLNTDFMPHGQCLFWQPQLLWAHVFADGLIALSYFSISACLLYFIRRRQALTQDVVGHAWVAILFAVFILLCGITHVIAIATLWNPIYVLEAWLKIATAAVSAATAIALVPVLPQLLSFKSPAQLQREVAARVTAERQLARTVIQLRQSNADLEQFAYVASHDLRAPLRNIASFAKLAKSKSGADLDPQVEEYLNYVMHGVHRMQSMIDDLLDLSKVDSEARTTVRVDLQAVLDTSLGDLRALISETRAQVTCGDLPEAVGNRSQLTQVLTNLISNAIKFQPPGRRPEVSIDARTEGDRVVITVRDNGIGIDERHTEKIFRLFSRLHGDGAFPGTGMGLAICKKIVERHGGRIGVESIPGSGTSFHFDIAARPAAKDSPPAAV